MKVNAVKTVKPTLLNRWVIRTRDEDGHYLMGAQKTTLMEIRVHSEANTLEQFEKEHGEAFFEDDEVALIAEQLPVFRCRVFDAQGSLPNLVAIRDTIRSLRMRYRTWLTKEEIIHALNKGYVVAVHGLGEVDLEDMERLED